MAGDSVTKERLMAAEGENGSAKPAKTGSEWQHLVIQSQTKGADKTGKVASVSATGPAEIGQRPDWNKIGQSALEIFKEIDTKNEGRVSRSMLASAVQDEKFNGDKAPVLAAMYSNFDQIANLAQGKPSSQSQSLNRDDITAFMKMAADAEKQFHVRNDLAHWGYSLNNLQKFAPSGVMTKQGLQQALSRKDLSAQDRSELENLQTNFDSISRDGQVKPVDLVSFDKDYEDKDKDFHANKAFLLDMSLVRTIQGASVHDLFTTVTDPIKSVTSDGVTAGTIGNCTFEATLSSLAAVRPQEIPQMIHPLPGGKVEVDFPGARKPITVNPLTDAEQGLFDRPNAEGLWNNVLQNANGQFLAKDKSSAKTLVPEENGALDPFQDQAITRATGHQVDNSLVSKLSIKVLNDQLLQANQNHRVVVFNTRAKENSDASYQATTQMGFQIEHAFSLVHVNTAGSQVTSVVVRDPRDHGSNRPDGEMQISLEQLKENFSTMSIETYRSASKR